MSNLNLDVDNAKGFGADVNLDQSWIHGLVEMSKSLDKSDRSLLNASEWVGKGAAGNGTEETDARTQAMHHGTIDSVRNLSRTEILSVRRLHLAPLQGLDVNDVLAWVGPLHRRTRGRLGGDYMGMRIKIQLL
jgi:hypothetical protein